MKSLAITLLILAVFPAVSAAEFTYAQSTDPDLVNRCFLLPEQYASITSTKVVRSVSEEAPPIDTTDEKPTINDLVYGQVFDENGNPWGGQEVRILWNVSGSTKSFVTSTLTTEEARLFGDASFTGYYFFNRGRIGDAEYWVEVVETVETLVAEQNVTEQNATESYVQPTPIIRQPAMAPATPNALKEFLSDTWRWLLSMLIVIVLAVLYQLRFKKAFDKFLFRPPKLSRSIEQLNKKNVRTFMNADFPVIDINASLRDLLAKVVHENYCIVEKEGRFLGLVTAEDLLAPMYKNEEQTIKNLMKHPHTLTPTTPFSQAAILSTEYRVLPVVKNGVAVGVVTRNQLLTMYDELYSLNPSGVRSIAKLQHAITQAVTISPHDSVEQLIERMIAEDTSTVIITEDKPIAIITELHVLEELMDYRDTLHQMTVSSFGGRLTTVEATASLLDANRIMLDAGLRAVPITHKGLLVGVLTQQSAMTELQAALKDYV